MTTYALSFVLACLVALPAIAQDVRERSDLGLMQRHITDIELLANRASSRLVGAAGARYHFDYQKFAADIARVHHGLNNYLSPSRAQPADLLELTGQYRVETPYSSPANEHD